MTHQPWTVKAWAGPYSWTSHDTDAPPGTTPPAGGILADPLILGEALADGDFSPLVPEQTKSATLNVLVAQVSDLGQLTIGATVTIRYWPSSAPAAGDQAPLWFAGRVATLTSRPTTTGVIFTMTCLDYTFDLAEPSVGAVAYPAESCDARIRRILGEAGVNVPAGTALYNGPLSMPNNVSLTARAAAPTSARELLLSTFAEYRVELSGSPGPTYLPNLAPALSPIGSGPFSAGPSALDTVNGPFLADLRARNPGFSAPLRVSLVAGVYKLTGSAAQSSGAGVVVLDGSRVSKAVSFVQRKGDSASAVAVNSSSFGQQTATWGLTPTVWATVQTDLLNASDGAALALFYLSPVKPTVQALWVADTLEWELDAEPGAWIAPVVGRSFMVVNIKLPWSPTLREWYAGVTAGTTLTLSGGVPGMTVDTLPPAIDPINSVNALRWSDLPAPMTYTNMSTRDTFTDYGLAGF